MVNTCGTEIKTTFKNPAVPDHIAFQLIQNHYLGTKRNRFSSLRLTATPIYLTNADS